MTITIGTTPVNLLLLLRGTTYAGASLPTDNPANPYQRPDCDLLTISNGSQAGGKLAWKDDKNITLDNCSDVVGAGDEFRFGPSGHYPNQYSLAIWLVAELADTPVQISIVYA